MSYQVLARKWRPKNFETLVGQEHVVRALTHALETERLHHAYLFTGTRGVGKTTLARILAKSLNCETGITAHPCGQCAACREIDEGRFIDLLEVDAATNTRVDEMRQLLENATYAPTRGRFKVYVIDEVHMLSNAAFNAMLKTLEEPPAHIKFILATTDPQKIPVTVLSRCLQFNLKQMPTTHIIEHATRLLEAEKIPFDPAALRHIAKAAGGSMRDALSLLDQAIAHGAGKVEDADVQAMLGTVGEDYLFAILDGLQHQNVAALLAIADEMLARSLAFHTALQGLASLLQRVAVAQFAPEAITDEFERNRLLPYAQAFSPEFVQLAYQIAIHGREDLALAPDDYAGFCMSLLRLAAFYPETGAPVPPSPTAAPGGAASSPKSEKRPDSSWQSDLPPADPPVTAPAQQPSQPIPGKSKLPKTVPPWEEEKTPLVPITSPQSSRDLEPAPTATASTTNSGNASPDMATWTNMVDQLEVSPMVREMARRCEWQPQSTPEQIVLILDERHAHLLDPGSREKLKVALTRLLGSAPALNITPGTTQATPAQQEEADQAQRLSKAQTLLDQDPFVRGMIEHFGANLVPNSIKPA